MKKILFLFILACLAFVAEAKLKFVKFEATRSSFVVEMTDTNPVSSGSLSGAWLKNDGKTYDALWYEITDRKNQKILRAIFPFQPSLRHVTIIFEIDGKRVKKTIDSDLRDYMDSNPYLRD